MCEFAGAAIVADSTLPGSGPVFLQGLQCSGLEESIFICDL